MRNFLRQILETLDFLLFVKNRVVTPLDVDLDVFIGVFNILLRKYSMNGKNGCSLLAVSSLEFRMQIAEWRVKNEKLIVKS